MLSLPDLLPCPFCNSEPIWQTFTPEQLHAQGLAYGSLPEGYKGELLFCGCRTVGCPFRPASLGLLPAEDCPPLPGVPARSRAEWVKGWNTRGGVWQRFASEFPAGAQVRITAGTWKGKRGRVAALGHFGRNAVSASAVPVDCPAVNRQLAHKARLLEISPNHLELLNP